MGERRFHWRANLRFPYPLWSSLVVLGVFLSFFGEILLGVKRLTHDSIHYFGPFYGVINALAQGRYPFWEPYNMMGQPLLINSLATGPLDPLVLMWLPLVRWGYVSILDVYHWTFIQRLFVVWLGGFLCFQLISRSRWVAFPLSLFFLISFAPMTFRQHGALVFMTYIPLIVWSALYCLNGKASNSRRSRCFMIFCVLLGVSSLFYIPQYLIASLGVLLICYLVANGRDGLRPLRDLNRNVIRLGCGVVLSLSLLIAVLSWEVVGSSSELFGLLRHELKEQSEPVSLSENLTTRNDEVFGVKFYHLMASFIPHPDRAYFMANPNAEHAVEVFACFGFPLLLVVLVLWPLAFVDSRRWLLMAVLFMTGLMYVTPFYRWIANIPSFSMIRQLHNFFGVQLFFWLLLVSVVLGGSVKHFRSGVDGVLKKKLRRRLVASIGFLILIYILYFCWTDSPAAHWLKRAWPSFLGEMFLVSALMVFLVWRPKRWDLAMAGLFGFLGFEVILFYWTLYPFVVQPASSAYLDARPSPQKALGQRVPVLPSLEPFWGSPGVLLGQSTLTFWHPKSQFLVLKRSYDLTQWVPAEIQNHVGGVTRPLVAFFNHVEKVSNQREALHLLQRATPDFLTRTLVVEDPTIQNELENLGGLSLKKLPIQLAEYYPQMLGSIDLKDNRIVQSSFGRNEILGRKIGTYQIFMTGRKESPMRASINPSFGFTTTTHRPVLQFRLMGSTVKCWLSHLAPSESLFCPMSESGLKFGGWSPHTGQFLNAGFEVRGVGQLEFDWGDRTSKIEIVEDGGDRLTLKLNSQSEGWLVVGQSFSSHWKLLVNGRSTPISPANFAFLGVPIDSRGESLVEIQYWPRVQIFALWLHFFALGGSFLWFAGSVVKGSICDRAENLA